MTTYDVKKNNYLNLLLNKKYLRFFISRIISRLGDVAFKIGLSWYVLELTGSAAVLGNTLFFSYLPQFIFGFFSGYIADRFDRKKVMVISDILRGILVLALFMTIIIFNSNSILLIYIISFVLASIKIFFNPSSMAFIPEIVEKNQLVTAGALNSVSIDIIDIVGNSIAGFGIALFGISSIFLFDSFTFFIGSFLIFSISQNFIKKSETHEISVVNISNDIKEGISYVFKNNFIRAFLGLLLISNISYGIMYTIPVILVKNELQLNAMSYGYIETALALGMFIGVLLVGAVSVKNVGKFFLTGLFLSGISLIIMSLAKGYYTYLFLFFLFGLFDSMTTPIYGYLQSYVEDKFRGRVFATLDFFIMLALPLIMLSIGNLVNYFGSSLLIGFSGLVLVISSLGGCLLSDFRNAKI